MHHRAHHYAKTVRPDDPFSSEVFLEPKKSFIDRYRILNTSRRAGKKQLDRNRAGRLKNKTYNSSSKSAEVPKQPWKASPNANECPAERILSDGKLIGNQSYTITIHSIGPH